ncbi:two-component system response regulator EvgA [Pseudomonas fluorescens]|uniref:response regulator n=1 Tax=Pseudomonas fluorescens TaxID=294 RepID=UPI0020A0A9E0|nr:response regulator transcription factor [Pseudomonas fluorescens]MCP1489905.1 two-component system response regulator EvgA [Pseudomonas fluorescens]
MKVIDMKRIRNPSWEDSPESKDRIIIADDNPVIRAMLVMGLINNEFTVVGQASNGIETLRLVQSCAPSLVLLDLDMPLMEGLSTLRQLQKTYPDLPVLVYSMLNASVYSYRCLRLGAKGFISKSDGISLILSAIRQVLQGQMLFPSHPMVVASGDLSDGEIVALRCLVRGGDIDNIASALMISSTHAAQLNQRLSTKLDMPTDKELIRFGKSLTLS